MKKIRSDDDLIWYCQYCGVENAVWIDFTAGNKQEIIEDCQVCCRPNKILFHIDIDDNISIEAIPLNE
jgi:Cysteine-rich CPXCG